MFSFRRYEPFTTLMPDAAKMIHSPRFDSKKQTTMFYFISHTVSKVLNSLEHGGSTVVLVRGAYIIFRYGAADGRPFSSFHGRW